MFSNKLVKNFTRNCSTFSRILKPNAKASCLIPQKSFKDFENSLLSIMDKVPVDDFTPEILDSLKKITEHSADVKQKLRGSLALYAFETIVKSENVTEESMMQMRTLAWSAEMVHSYFLILKDAEIGVTKNQYDWCLQDAGLFRSFVYEILKTHFQDKPTYVDLRDLIDKAFLYTAVGNKLLASSKARNYCNFTIKRYNSIVDYKSFHTFKLPIFLATTLVKNIDYNTYYERVDNICTDIGRFYQVKNDYSNYYGEVHDEPGLPKHNEDIIEGKLTWLAVVALQRCNPAQRIVFHACYGSKEPAHIERIQLLYDQLNIKTMYEEEKDRMYQDVIRKTKQLNDVDPQLFLRTFDLIKNGMFKD